MSTTNIPELTKARAAGIFDGEGSCLISETIDDRYAIVVKVGTTSERISS